MSKTKKKLAALALLTAVAVLVVIVWVASYEPFRTPMSGLPAGDGAALFAWRGVVHVHTDASDGAGDLEEVLGAANRAGVDFLVLSDHNPLGRQAKPGWRDDVLLLVAQEISTEEGHLLAFEVPEHRYRFGPTARQALNDIDAEGGWAVVAHPAHRWQSWSGGWGGSVGVEIANLAAAWSRGSGTGSMATVVTSLIDGPRGAVSLLDETWPAIRTWDTLTALATEGPTVPRPRVAIGSADAHGPILGPLPFPSYERMLTALSMLVWIDEPPPGQLAEATAADLENKLLKAIRDGRAAVETTALGDARAFAFTASTSSGEQATIGELINHQRGPWTLSADFRAAGPFKMRMLRDGVVVAEAEDRGIEEIAGEAGTYRVEIYRNDGRASAAWRTVPWLISNPIYVWPEVAMAAARWHRAPPLPPPPLTEDLLATADFEANQVGVTHNVVDAGADGVSWSFGLEADSAREAFAAMAWRPTPPRDWSAAAGLVIELHAEQPMRARLEFRTEASDGSLQSWVHSVRAGPDAPARAIDWNKFRPPWSEDEPGDRAADVRHPGAVDLAAVRGVFLVVTPVMLAPGSRVEATLHKLGLFGSG